MDNGFSARLPVAEWRYTRYHGSREGWDQIMADAAIHIASTWI
jgi:hypothetical protein